MLADGACREVTLAPYPDIFSAVAILPVDSVLDAGLASLPRRELYGREGLFARWEAAAVLQRQAAQRRLPLRWKGGERSRGAGSI